MLLPNPEESKQVFVDSFKTYLLPRIKIENYNIEIDGRNFYNQPINGSIKQYDEVKIFKLIADDLSKKLYMLIQEQFNTLFLLVK